MAAVGNPPLQKNASILPSLSASADSRGAEPLPLTSFAGSRPAADSSRSAVTSVPLPGDPVDTVWPRRSATRRMPDDASVTIWV